MTTSPLSFLTTTPILNLMTITGSSPNMPPAFGPLHLLLPLSKTGLLPGYFPFIIQVST